MINLRKSFIVELTGTLLCSVLVAVCYCNDVSVVFGNKDSIDSSLLTNLGEDEFYSVYDYKYVDLSFVQLVAKDRDTSFCKPEFDGNDKDRLYKIIEYLEQFTYTENQPNPNKVKDLGGNCQALSIMFRDICEFNGISCTITGTKTHALNLVTVGGTEYKVDITNKTLERSDD